MITKEHILDRISETFPFLRDATEELKSQISEHALYTEIPKGEFILVEGDECKHFVMVLSGMARVYKTSESGREITLYRLRKGDTCILTASCALSDRNFPAVAVAEEDVEAVLIPSQIFQDWVNRFDLWRNHVFTLLSESLSEMMSTLEEVAFRRMDLRIAEFLVRSSESNNLNIDARHQDIAMELGSSREVVSRILKNFEYEKLIELKRGSILILDRDQLIKNITREKF